MEMVWLKYHDDGLIVEFIATEPQKKQMTNRAETVKFFVYDFVILKSKIIFNINTNGNAFHNFFLHN